MSGTERMTGIGTFETCRQTSRRSAYRGRAEVIGTPSQSDAIDPERTREGINSLLESIPEAEPAQLVAGQSASSMTFERHLRGRPVALGEIGWQDPKLIDAVVAEAPVHQVVVGQLQQHDVAFFAHGAGIALDFDAPAKHLMP